MVKFRVAEESDLEVIADIERSVYPTPWTLNFFRLMLGTSKDLFIVAVIDGEVIGYTVGEIRTMGLASGNVKVGHVMNVAVMGIHQGKGIGTMLMDEVEKRIRDSSAGIVYLEVRESNAVARSMYRERGYEFVRTAKDYYGDEDGIVMTKNLDEFN